MSSSWTFGCPIWTAWRRPAQIKARRPKTQVIFLTFYGDPELTQGTEGVEAFCYLVKGCPPSMIVEMIRRAFERGRQATRRPVTS